MESVVLWTDVRKAYASFWGAYFGWTARTMIRRKCFNESCALHPRAEVSKNFNRISYSDTDTTVMFSLLKAAIASAMSEYIPPETNTKSARPVRATAMGSHQVHV